MKDGAGAAAAALIGVWGVEVRMGCNNNIGYCDAAV